MVQGSKVSETQEQGEHQGPRPQEPRELHSRKTRHHLWRRAPRAGRCPGQRRRSRTNCSTGPGGSRWWGRCTFSLEITSDLAVCCTFIFSPLICSAISAVYCVSIFCEFVSDIYVLFCQFNFLCANTKLLKLNCISRVSVFTQFFFSRIFIASLILFFSVWILASAY